MKKNRLFLLLFAILFLVGCSNEKTLTCKKESDQGNLIYLVVYNGKKINSYYYLREFDLRSYSTEEIISLKESNYCETVKLDPYEYCDFNIDNKTLTMKGDFTVDVKNKYSDKNYPSIEYLKELYESESFGYTCNIK